MERIKAQIDPKDRVICVTLPNEHRFFYQAYGSKKRIPLFEDERIPFSGSRFAFFRDKGRNLEGRGFSLTVKELYEHRKLCRNPKIAKLFDRLPGAIDRAVREQGRLQDPVKRRMIVKETNEVCREDAEFAA